MIGLILLSQNDVYVKYNGKLPKRPEFDKGLLTAFLHGQTVSYKAWSLLPPSVQKIVYCSDIADSKCPVTIRELANTEVLVIIRSVEKGSGKKFRLDKFNCVVKTKEIELWQKK